jgi:hypothetical protein
MQLPVIQNKIFEIRGQKVMLVPKLSGLILQKCMK